MTLVAAWLRRNGPLTEMVVAGDSRLNAGPDVTDAAPKVISLPRPATVVAMSGDATEAYAFLLQAVNATLLLDGHTTGRTDIGNLAIKLRDAYGTYLSSISDPALSSGPQVPKLDVCLFGWSWRNLCFEGYSYRYGPGGALVMHRLTELRATRAHPVYFFGDAAVVARRKLRDLLSGQGVVAPRRGSPPDREEAADAFLDWEPFQVLLDIIQDRAARTVGGAPQLAKIFQYGATELYVWRDAKGRDFFGGRPVGSTERFDRRIATWAAGELLIEHSDRSIMSTANNA